MSKRRKTRRISITVPEAFHENLVDLSEITGLSISRLAWLRLKKSRCIIVPTEVACLLRNVERMLQAGNGLSYSDRAMLENVVDDLKFLIER